MARTKCIVIGGLGMAVAGSGGWVPSCRVVEKRGGLVATGIVSNKPANLCYSDTEKGAFGSLADAVVRLRRGEAIQCDMTGGQFLRLVGLWKSGSGDEHENEHE